jgi:hypothetical protein
VDSSPIHRTTKGGVSVMNRLLGALDVVDFTKIPENATHSEAKATVEDMLVEARIEDEGRRQWMLMNLGRHFPKIV